jgi:hypothetical protein
VALFINLRLEPSQHRLRRVLVDGRAGETRLATGQRVDAGVEDHREGVAALAYVPSPAALTSTLHHAQQCIR